MSEKREEKQQGSFANNTLQEDSDVSLRGEGQPEWNLADELRVRTKVDMTVLPLLFLGLLVFQLDRMNIASALTGGFATDIHVTQSTINLGNQLMFMSIVIFEIPCNMALQRVGPRKWISAQVFAFGFIAIMQVFIKNRGGFLATRLLLGFAEAGYIPGACYTLSTWYNRRELAKRVAIFFFGMFGGNAISPLLASGILLLDGHRGLRGWQWLFLLEGLFTICVSIVLLVFLPGSPSHPKPLLSSGVIRFSEAESKILLKRLEKDGDEDRSGQGLKKIPLSVVWSTVSHYRRWPHFVSTFVVFSTWSPLTTYTPSIIMSLGFDRTRANALAAVGAFLALAVVFMFAFLSDRTNQRGASVIAAQTCYLITLIVARSLQPHVGKWSRWGLWTAVNSFAVGYHPVHNSWVQLNCNDPRERSISIAMWVMSAISGLMAGAQYFQADDKPLYSKGLRIMIIMVSIGIASAIVQLVVYIRHNQRVAEGKSQREAGLSPRVYVP
ncbi:MFS inner membrane transporter yfaV [Trichoderma simmonsii]|uniref:MFS inner membrane transporter yfaV n=1 Tax=Trichoderma simmonsii TaxID=1491479 RepID=A0A8G0LST7_9HYPO|nr:MFS inner membrane transporter yfaV [Trichoderma simmonsii]